MPEEGTATATEEPVIDTTDPNVINPILGALGGRSLEDYLSTGGQDPTQTQPPAPPPQDPTQPVQQPVQPPAGEQKQAGEEDIAPLIEIDPMTLTTRGGAPVGEVARQKFKTIQSALKAKDEKLKAALKEVEELRNKPGPTPEEMEANRLALEEKEKMRRELDIVNFEHSPEWKATFETPIKEQTDKISKILQSIKMDKDEKDEMLNHIREAEALLGDPDNLVQYNNIVDLISAEYMKPTTANAFSRAMTTLFEKSHERAEAYKDKGKARDTILESMAKKSNASTKSLQDRMDAELMAFEKTDVGQIFKKTADFDFDSTSKANREKALTAIRDLQVTGQVTNDLAEMMRSYALKPAMEKEREFLISSAVKLSKTVEDLIKEKDELTRRIMELRGEGGTMQTPVQPGNNGQPDWSARGIFGAEGMKILDSMGVGR